jgi:hypothetical protein
MTTYVQRKVSRDIRGLGRSPIDLVEHNAPNSIATCKHTS